MNIKKILMLASITVQFSTIIHAFSQDNYNAAFYAFETNANINPNSATAIGHTYKQSAAFVSQYGNAKSRTYCESIAKSLGTAEAKAVGFFLADGTNSAKVKPFTGADGLSGSAMSFTNLQAAIAAAPNTLPVTAVTTNLNPQLSDNPNVPANWVTALNAFGGAQGVFDKTATKRTVVSSGLAATSAAYKDAQVIEKYLASAQAKGIYSDLNSTDGTNLDAAFTTANVSRGTLPPANTEADNRAAALKAEIQSSIGIYNQYASTAGKQQLPVIA
jgi:hypothetical protein